MTECILCKVTPIQASKTELFAIDAPDLQATHYYGINSVISEPLKIEDFKTSKAFTPGARLKLELTEAVEILNHIKVWKKFLSLESPHAIVLNNKKDAEDKQLSIFIENKELPKDWDIVLISRNQYILTKRAAKILLMSSHQITNNLNAYIFTFESLKIIRLKEGQVYI